MLTQYIEISKSRVDSSLKFSHHAPATDSILSEKEEKLEAMLY
jgi:hypothetical protein